MGKRDADQEPRHDPLKRGGKTPEPASIKRAKLGDLTQAGANLSQVVLKEGGK